MADENHETDPRLMRLLGHTVRQDPEATLELTVVVDGIIISGSVVSEQAWKRQQNDQIRNGSPAVADAFEALDSTADEQEDLYIHFLGPALRTGGVQVPVQPTRVDLRRVSAWSIGRIPE